MTKAYRQLKLMIVENGEPPCSTAADKTPWQKAYPADTPASMVRKVCEDCPLATLNACRAWGRDSNLTGVAGGILFRASEDERMLDLAGDALENVGGIK